MGSRVNADEWVLVVSSEYGRYYRPSIEYHERRVREMIADGISESSAKAIQRTRVRHWEPK